MDYLTGNLDALAQRHPELARRLWQTPPAPGAELETSRSGLPVLKVGRTRLTSSVDPQEEGARQAAQAPSGPLLALGFVLGYHLEPLLGRDLVVWEPDLGLLRLALMGRDLRYLLGNILLVTEAKELDDLAPGRSAFEHRAYARLRPLEAQALARRLERKVEGPTRPSHPRVLVVPALLGGTLPTAYWCAEALTDLGCQVMIPPLEKMAPLYRLMFQQDHSPERLDRLRAPMIRFLGELVTLKAEEFQPHLVLALAQAPLDRQALGSLKALGCRTAMWFVEDFRLMVYFREVAAFYDHFFHIQGEDLTRELERLGANHAYLPVAAHPPVHRPLELSELERKRFGGQVGFIGAGYANRRRIFAELVEKGLPLRLWGVTWPKEGPLAACLAEKMRYLDSEEVVRIYNACSVIINLHSSPRQEQRIGGADFVNPRTLEVPACGGFQLVDEVERLGEFLTPGREVATFTGQDDLLEKVGYYLQRPGERAALAQAGRRRILAGHTYWHRLEELLSRCLGQAPARAAEGGSQPAEADAVPRAALGQMLDRLAARAA